MTRLVRLLLVPVLLTLGPAPALAQASDGGNVWARGTEIGVVLAGAADATTTGPAIGGTAGWEVTRLLGIEGRGLWFGRGTGADGFGADLSALVNVVPRQRITPFVTAGFGLYRASFDSPAAPMSDFYRRRFGAMAGTGPIAGHHSFTDPAVRLGGGIDLLARRSLALRPEASVLLVRRSGRHGTIVTFGMRIAYRFEDHPVTPDSR